MEQSRSKRLAPWVAGAALLALATYHWSGSNDLSKAAPQPKVPAPRTQTRREPAATEPAAQSGGRATFPPYDPFALRDAETALTYFRTLGSQEMFRVLERLVYDEDKVDPGVKRMLLAALFQIWTERDLDGAIAAVAEHDTAMWALIAGWARLDPLAVWRWVEATNRSDANSSQNPILRIAVQTGREGVMAELLLGRLQSHPDDGVQGIGFLLSEWAIKDPGPALEWLGKIEGINPFLATLFSKNLGPPLAKLAGPKLDQLVNAQTVPVSDALVAALAQEWVTQNQLDRLKQYANDHPNLPATRQDGILMEVGSAMVREEPDLALQILGRLHDPTTRDQRISAGVSALQGDGPIKSGKAMDYALAIANESMRLTRLKQAYAIFAERYPEEARDFVSRDAFPSQLRSALLPPGSP